MRLQAAKALTFLGFSEIEALVYCFLLEESPATGYRVSHAIGKPTANTYKAIAALALRGAIIIDDSESRLCRAVPPGELLDRLNREFDEHKRTAEAELAQIRQAEGDDRVYYLATPDQVIERARSMLAAAQEVALLDIFPRLVPLVADDLVAAARHGVRVALRAYAPAEIKGVTVVVGKSSDRILSAWPGQHLLMAIDADQFMTAMLSRDVSSVYQALWSGSTFLSCMQHNAIAVELAWSDIVSRSKNAATDALDELSLTRLRPRGFRKMIERKSERSGNKKKPKRRANP